MKLLFSIGHAVLATLFAALAVLLTVVAVRTTWEIVARAKEEDRKVD